MKKFITIAAAAAFLFMGTLSASAQTVEEQIQALMEQLAALNGGSTMTSSTPFNWNGTLIRTGSVGSQVSDLQACMNALGFSTGIVDGNYGPNTFAGITAFQASKGYQVDGVVGAETAPGFEAACNASSVEDEEADDEDDTDEDDFDTNDGEEADFSDFDLDDADDDTIEEGVDKVEIAEYVFELEDEGAALLERMDIVLTFSGADDGDELDAWEVFDNFYLSVDGDIIAEIEGDDEDEWDDTSVNAVNYEEARLRFSGINHVFDADDEHTIVLHADIAGSLDLGGDNASEWTVRVSDTGLRFVDEAGITQYLATEAGSDTDTAVFTIEEEGQDDELDVQSSNDDPESTTLKVEDDEASDDYTVFVFELEADEDSSDVELEKVGVTVTIVPEAGVPGATFDTVVKDATLVIDGEEFDDIDTYVDGAIVTLVFDIDQDFTVDSGDTVDAELVLEFKSANGVNYGPGVTVQSSVLAAAVTGEGAEDLVAGGSATGDVHTLLVEGINAEVTSTSENVVVVDGEDNDYAEFEIEIDVDAFEVDAFISQFAATSLEYSIIDASNGDIAHTEAGAGTVATGSAVISVSSNANLEGGTYYRVNENDTETFTISVTYTPANVGAVSGSYRLQLDAILFEDSAALPTVTYATIPTEDYSTTNANITN
jgi:hypothetical protein